MTNYCPTNVITGKAPANSIKKECINIVWQQTPNNTCHYKKVEPITTANNDNFLDDLSEDNYGLIVASSLGYGNTITLNDIHQTQQRATWKNRIDSNNDCRHKSIHDSKYQ